MHVTSIKPVFSDERGVVTDIVEDKDINSVTILTSKKGSIRGNHYHKKTTQYAYVAEGKFKVFTQSGDMEIESRIIGKGDLVINPPNEKHAFLALEDSTLLACASGVRAGKHYEDDTFRLDTPISETLGN